MSIPVDDEKIYSLYLEGKLSDISKIGTMAAASLFGGAQTSHASLENPNRPQINFNVNDINIPQFIDIWGQFYLAKVDRANDIARANRVLSQNFRIPQVAMDTIYNAVDIFGGDEGVSPQVLEALLIYTGQVETEYRTRRQLRDGPARGFWQVEPETAISLIQHSTAYFGPKFKRQFGTEILKINRDTPDNRRRMAQLILEDDNLAAAFAAAKWISVAKVVDLNRILVGE